MNLRVYQKGEVWGCLFTIREGFVLMTWHDVMGGGGGLLIDETFTILI
jgi:hypothetical protein